MTDTVTTVSIFAALSAAQGKFKPISKNKTNPAFKGYKYADLQAILDACKPALTEQGLFLTQRVESCGKSVKVETVVYNASGESLSSGILEIGFVSGKNPAQDMGSAITYARRYSLSTFLGVAADDDDDGNGAGAGNTPQEFVLTQAMADAALAAAEGGVEAYKKYYQSRPEEERVQLSKLGYHKECYAKAKEADAAKETPNKEAA